ncbi:MAG: D-alanyl-D-alanine carboxypeptidase family protein [Butyricicoccaceae bacterium]
MTRLKQRIAALALACSLIAPFSLSAAATDTAPEDTQTAQTTQAATTDDTQSKAEGSSNQTSGGQAAQNTDTAQQAEPEEDPDAIPEFAIDAKAAILVNAETGDVVYEKNATEKMYPASTTKILTALLVLENLEPDDTITMTKEDVNLESGSSNAGLVEGETLTVEDLLYCLMLPSANEAANAFAREIAGSNEAFADMMNERAKELGCVNTHFVNANGLHDEDHYTCAKDLVIIAQEAMKHELFAEIANTAQHRLPETNKHDSRIILTTNHLILSRYSDAYYDAAHGIKTGHTTPAGYCLVAEADKNGYTYYSAVLGASQPSGSQFAGSFTETARMFDWAFDNWRLRTAASKGVAITEQHVRLGKGTDSVTMVTQEDVQVLIPKNLDTDKLKVSYDIDEEYTAPIAKGTVLGTVTYSYEGKDYATANLVALTDIDRSMLLFILDQIDQFLHTIVFKLLALVLIVFAVLYGIRQRALRKKRKARAKRTKTGSRK